MTLHRPLGRAPSLSDNDSFLSGMCYVQQGRSRPGEELGYIQSALHLKNEKENGKTHFPQLLPFCAVKINILSPSHIARADGEYFPPSRNHF